MTSLQQTDLAWIFPGQGSQAVGMAHDLYQAFPTVADLYARADALLDIPLSRLSFEGPEAALTETINAQPALLTASVAVLLALGGRLDEEGWLDLPPGLERPRFVAGHSLGEYTALVAARALTFPHALHLVRERGRLMGEAQAGAMAAVIGLDEMVLEEICQQCAQGDPLVIANYNSPGQLVLSGAVAALERAMEEAKSRDARRVIPLKVSAAFHSPLMEQAAADLARVVADTPFAAARIPIVANASAEPIRELEEIRCELVAQVCSPVRWIASLRWMAKQGVDRFWELGPGKVLTGLVRRTLPDAAFEAIGTLEQVQAVDSAEA